MKPKNDPNTIPSLYARLTSAPARPHGFAVTCTATAKPLGEIWWTVEGVFVSWHYHAVTGEAGICGTKRGAVQVLRDLTTPDGPAAWLPFTTPAPTSGTATGRPQAPKGATVPRPTPAPGPAPVAPSAPARRVVWDDAAPAFDITAAIAAGLKGRP